MSARQTRQAELELGNAVELRQERSFATSYLSLTNGWALKHRQDLELIVAGLPAGWALDDRLVAHFFPDLKPSVFAFHHGAGPDLYQLLNDPAVVERVDYELVGKVRDALSALWVKRDAQAHRRLSRATRTKKTAHGVDCAQYSTPDVVVTVLRGAPLVSLSQEYQAKRSPERCNQAQALCTALFAHQLDFLSIGFGGIKPLSVRALADQLGVHESTASRTLAGLVADTPFGIVPLREFFGSALRTVDDDKISPRIVKELIRQFLSEDTAAFTDEELVARLRDDGIILARRTASKYRAQLGFPTTSARRRASQPAAIIVDDDAPATEPTLNASASIQLPRNGSPEDSVSRG